MKKIAIIDYGMGNLFSIKSACKKVGLNGHLSDDERNIMKSDAVILPGVGSFFEAMNKIKIKNLDSILKKFQNTQKPIIGICLGMQLFFDKSYEYKETNGLGLIKGEVKKLSSNNHLNIGWHPIIKKKNHPIVKNINDKSHMFFVHSYYCKPIDNEIVLTETNYLGFSFCSSVQKSNIFGFQFHPEKSGENGLNFYYNIKELV